MREQTKVVIKNTDFWVKQPAFLQYTWAIIEKIDDKIEGEPGGKYIIFFLDDRGGVFDRIEYASPLDAEIDLQNNGFENYNDIIKYYSSYGSVPPKPDYYESRHPNGNIYSSGRYWKSLKNNTYSLELRIIAVTNTGEDVAEIKKISVPKEIEKNYNSECTILEDKEAGKPGFREIHVFSFFYKMDKIAEGFKYFFDEFLLPNIKVFSSVLKSEQNNGTLIYNLPEDTDIYSLLKINYVNILGELNTIMEKKK
jgi:hypothetical protein